MGLNGCSPRPQDPSKEKLLKASRLIDAGKPDEAISYLEKLIEQEPQNTDAKVALSSAYAAKAGIKVTSFAGMIINARSVENVMAELSKNAEPSTTPTGQVDEFLKKVSSLMSKASGVARIYVDIPEIRDDVYPYLLYAIEILEEQKDLKAEDKIFKVIMEIIVLKHMISTDLVVGIFQKDWYSQKCVLNFNKFNRSLIKTGKLVVAILEDLEVAHPSKAKELNELSGKIVSSISDLTSAATSITVLDEASQMFLKNAIISAGIGNLAECQP